MRLFALIAVTGALAAIGCAPPVAAAPKLTCSFIQKQCMTECAKQVSIGFCKIHCDGQKSKCLKSGTWSSFGREFTNVIRR